MIKQDNNNTSSLSTSSLSSSSSSKLVSGIGFFNLDGITILHDRVHTRADIEQLLVHELVHAVDHHVTKLDLSTCGGLACSEIRAAKLAECYASWNLGGVKKRCTRNFAETSTRMVFGPIHGPVCVDAVFDQCYKIEKE
jgi:inner membrane protease ATP23